ncbi:LAMI_0H15412g1_1 [Lachancea mirantina]|uniref:LAMI_0H15412g1_1 n=1 Tax=Lachancea mirantina TaxID=1230905 RepID=A0A1G4KIP2_9SACH|nr:LAMI_0H15412g1_1 [Lachancea mirantina]
MLAELRVFTFLLSFCLGSHLLEIENASNFSQVSIPDLNFSASSNGEVGFLGDFDGFSFYHYVGQQNFTEIQDLSASSLNYYSEGVFIELCQASNFPNDSQINHIVPVGPDSFVLSGNGTMAGHALDKQILYNITTQQYRTLLANGISNINQIFVHGDGIYFGGDFEYSTDTSRGHSAVVWNISSETDCLLPFGGFGEGSEITSIVALDNGTLLFAGKFDTLDNPTYLKSPQAANSTNQTFYELSQQIPMQLAAWTSSDGSIQEDALRCPTGTGKTGWLVENQTTGRLNVAFPNVIYPKKIRIYNGVSDDERVSMFRLLSSPTDGIMNLTYLDPLSGSVRSCDASCPLLSSSVMQRAMSNGTDNMSRYWNSDVTLGWSSTYQEFAFVNQIPTEGLSFLALDSFGSSVSLSGVQLYASQYFVYANNTLNEIGCGDTSQQDSYSVLSSSSSWTNSESGTSYVSTDFDMSEVFPSVAFHPEIQIPGNYTIDLLTPGCLQDNSCLSRIQSNVSVYDSQNNTLLYTGLIYQNNDYDKIDTIFSGFLNSAPEVSLTAHASIQENGKSVFVAGCLLIDQIAVSSSVFDAKDICSLNGILKYDVNQRVNLGDSSIEQYATTNFENGSRFILSSYHDSLLLSAPSSGLELVNLSNSSLVTEKSLLSEGSVEDFFPFSDGVLISGSFDSNATNSSSFLYNGTLVPFESFRGELRQFSNITIDGAELFVLNNDILFNTTSQKMIENSAALSLSIFSSGSNENDDLVFFGRAMHNDFTTLNGAAFFNSENRVSSGFGADLNSKSIVYNALFVDQSRTAIAKYDKIAKTHIVEIADGDENSITVPETFSAPITCMSYNHNMSTLAIGLGSGANASQFTLYNTSSNKLVTTYTLDVEASVSSFVFLERNFSILVAGGFSISSTNCIGLCLFDMAKQEWSPFFNNSIKGMLSDMKVSNQSELIISGNFAFHNHSSINLARLSPETSHVEVLRQGLSTLNGFAFMEDEREGLFTFDNSSLAFISNNTTKSISLPDLSTDPVIEGIRVYPLLEKSTSSPAAQGLVLTGRFAHPMYGNLSAMIFDFKQWYPYFSTVTTEPVLGSKEQRLFANKDESGFHNYQYILPSTSTSNSTMPSSSNGPSAPSSGSALSKKRNKVDRGFVVLIGLALALGTIALLGILGLLFAILIQAVTNKDNNLSPRLSEGEMIDTVPPEKLMKFL